MAITLAHSEGNALDRTVPHVASRLLARLANLIVRTDIAGIFRVPAHNKEPYHVFRFLQSILTAGR
jgi:hypothetical protein